MLMCIVEVFNNTTLSFLSEEIISHFYSVPAGHSSEMSFALYINAQNHALITYMVSTNLHTVKRFVTDKV